MLLDGSSATAFAPPPLAALYEPVGRRGVGPAPDPRPHRRALQNSSNSLVIGELSLQLASERAESALASEKPAAQNERLYVAAAELSKRMQFLRIEAEIDRTPFSDASFADFQDFMREMRRKVRPSIFLNDNGNLRALWKSDQREQIGLQFLGDGNIQFVIFKQRKGPLGMARIAGVDARDKVLAHIKASGAEGLLIG
jgi:hypothetical protein